MHFYIPLGAKYAYEQSKELSVLSSPSLTGRYREYTSLLRRSAWTCNVTYIWKIKALAELRTEIFALPNKPAFLFNSLNTICGIIDKNNALTRDSMVEFADLLRYGLYDANADSVELEKEISYLKNYMNFQQMPQNERLVAELIIDIQTEEKELCLYYFCHLLRTHSNLVLMITK